MIGKVETRLEVTTGGGLRIEVSADTDGKTGAADLFAAFDEMVADADSFLRAMIGPRPPEVPERQAGGRRELDILRERVKQQEQLLAIYRTRGVRYPGDRP